MQGHGQRHLLFLSTAGSEIFSTAGVACTKMKKTRKASTTRGGLIAILTFVQQLGSLPICSRVAKFCCHDWKRSTYSVQAKCSL